MQQSRSNIDLEENLREQISIALTASYSLVGRASERFIIIRGYSWLDLSNHAKKCPKNLVVPLSLRFEFENKCL
jgi:hypothetical protein